MSWNYIFWCHKWRQFSSRIATPITNHDTCRHKLRQRYNLWQSYHKSLSCNMWKMKKGRNCWICDELFKPGWGLPAIMNEMDDTWEINFHDDIIKWKHFPRNWPFVRGIHRSPVNSPHNGQWRGALKFSLSCAWINAWVNNCDADDLRRHRAHHDVTVICSEEHGRLWGGNYSSIP